MSIQDTAIEILTLVSSPQTSIPDLRLRDDAIVEAVCVVHFQAKEPLEVVIGRLSDVRQWDSFQIVRLPVADIPAPIRQSDPAWKFQPSFQLRNNENNRLIQFGENTFSYHVVGTNNYSGWKNFLSELGDAFGALFEKLNSPEVRRIGFRYVNAVVPSRHYINSAHELNLEIQIGSENFKGPINLNYITKDDESHSTTTRIAHKSFVQGNLPADTEVVIDVEVNTPQSYRTTSKDEVLEWVKTAHDFEKIAFFRLIPQNIIDKLKKD